MWKVVYSIVTAWRSRSYTILATAITPINPLSGNLNKSDWTTYRESVAFSISHHTEPNPIQPASINTALVNFVHIITEAADLAIPKTKTTSSNSKSKLTPWWNEQYSEAVKNIRVFIIYIR